MIGRSAPLRRLGFDGSAGIPFAEFGDPAGRPLVIVPGIADGLRPIGRVGAAFAAVFYRDFHSFRVIVPSRREPTPPGHTTEDMADDLAALLEALAAAPAVVHGISMGGFIAQHLAVRHPHLVERLVLGATVGHVDAQTAAIVDRWERLARQERWADFQRDMLETVYTGEMPLRYRLTTAANRRGIRLMPGPLFVERYAAHSAAARRHDARRVLADIRCPTLALGGSEDLVTRPDQMRELVEAIPGAHLRLFDRAGHGAFEQRKPDWDRAVLTFSLGGQGDEPTG